MPLLNLTAASRVAGVGRSTIVRSLKSGRLSATTNEQGERVIDTSELSRVFGPLKSNDYPNEQAVDSHDIGVITEVSRKSTLSENQRSISVLRKRSFMHQFSKN